MRAAVPALILGILSACSPSIPDSGVGFGSSSQTQRARDTALTTGQPMVIPPTALSQETLAPAAAGTAAAPVAVAGRSSSATSSAASSDIAAETAAALAAASANSGQAPIQASPSNPPPKDQAGISNENDFSAVSGRYSIADDAQRLARNREQFQVVAPTALPTRSGAGSQPNIVNYALKTNNPRGTRIYSRTGINLAARSARKCAGFASPDQAQIAFLAAGGPKRDREALDPDGDGYACAWDPEPFRQAVKN